MCKTAYALYNALGFEPRQFSVALHYFVTHCTQRVVHHGSLIGMFSEGGEHVHQPHGEIVQKPLSCPRYKCPIALIGCMQDASLRLALWRQRWLTPYTNFEIKFGRGICFYLS